jgi:hypothetical protein
MEYSKSWNTFPHILGNYTVQVYACDDETVPIWIRTASCEALGYISGYINELTT